MTTEERTEWVKTLKAGDTICYKVHDYYVQKYQVTTIKSITPKGMLRTSDDRLFNVQGRSSNGDCWIYLEPYTAEVEASVYRHGVLEKARHSMYMMSSNRVDIAKIPNEFLLEIVSLEERISKYLGESSTS